MMRQYELVERVVKYDPDANEDLLNRAYVYAMKAHGNQTRASGEAYFNHPLEVAAILTEMKLDDATIAAALLHDTVEDTEATHQEIEEKFGKEIASLVDGLTKIKKIDLVTTEATQAENLRKLLLAMSKDVRVLMVKLADRLHNMRTIEHVKPDKRLRMAQETMDIYAPLAGRMGMQTVRDELEDISFRVLNPDANKIIQDRLSQLHEESGDVLREIEKALATKLAENGIKAEVYGREKRPYSIWRKMERKHLSLGQLSDIFGFRVLVGTVDQCYRAIGIVHRTWRAIPGRFKDYISTPKQNDYRSLHTIVIGPHHMRVEMQIRTRLMHEIAERGVAAHALYKDAPDAKEALDGFRPPGAESNAYRWLRHLVEMLQEGESPKEFLEHTKLELFHDQVFCFTPKGQLIALAARRHAHRFCLCGAYLHRRQLRGLQGEWPACAAGGRTRKWRRGGHHPLRRAGAAAGLGKHRGDRQGPRGDQARDAGCHAQAICRAWPRNCRKASGQAEQADGGQGDCRRGAAPWPQECGRHAWRPIGRGDLSGYDMLKAMGLTVEASQMRESRRKGTTQEIRPGAMRPRFRCGA